MCICLHLTTVHDRRTVRMRWAFCILPALTVWLWTQLNTTTASYDARLQSAQTVCPAVEPVVALAALIPDCWVLQALASKGKAGGTVQELEDIVAAREASCVDGTKNATYMKRTYNKLRGSHHSVRHQLAQVSQHALFQTGVVVCLEATAVITFSILMLQQTPGILGCHKVR